MGIIILLICKVVLKSFSIQYDITLFNELFKLKNPQCVFVKFLYCITFCFNKLTTSEICLDSYMFRDLILHGEKEMNVLIYELIN